MLFGILALLAVGLSWTTVGIVMGLAPKKNVDPALLQFFGAIVSTAAGLVIFACTADKMPAFRDIWWVFASYAGNGFLNCIMLIIMSKAMQKGPNGIIWTIIQSAMMFPFLMGIIFFDVEPKIVRFAGLFLILASLAIFGFFKDNTVKGGGWKLLTFTAFAMTGVILSLAALPSYFEVGRNLSPALRSSFAASGVLVSAAVSVFIKRREIKFRDNIRSKYMWIFIGVSFSFSLIFTYLLLYPGMDIMAENGMGSVSHPLLIGSCMIGFFLYSVFILKEKIFYQQYIALVLGLIGIGLICC